MTRRETEFVVFCIEELAAECGMSGNDMYRLLSASFSRLIVSAKIFEILQASGDRCMSLKSFLLR